MFTSSKIIHNIRSNRPPIRRVVQSPRRCGSEVPHDCHTVHNRSSVSRTIVGYICPTNSTKSAYEALNGQKFDWNRTPLAPIGQQALAFLDPANPLTWAPHTTDAFTLGFTQDHYRLLRVWNKLTGGCLTTGTYVLYPAY